MKYLIINADDFGMTEGVSKGIIDACEHGIVSSTTFLANSECFEFSASLLRSCRDIGVGVHLALTSGCPVSSNVPSLLTEQGAFFREHEFEAKLEYMDYCEIKREFLAQIEKVRKAGIEITHFDAHSHILEFKKVSAAVVELAREYGVAVRKTADPPPDIKTTEGFTRSFYGQNATELNIKMLLKKYEKCASLEITCHPGYCDPELLIKESYSKKREMEIAVMKSIELKAHVSRLGIEMITFAGLPG